MDAVKVGTRVGRLTVEAPTDQRKNGYIVWSCRCDCGKRIFLDTRALQRGAIQDCGCTSGLAPGQRDITGQRFGRNVSTKTAWLCRCDCGKETVVGQTLLLDGRTKSCGCIRASVYKENLKLVEGTSITILKAIKSGRLIKSNTSGYTGVYYNKKRGMWTAQITFQGRNRYLGSFSRLEDAVKARQRGEEIYDEFLEQFGEG